MHKRVKNRKIHVEFSVFFVTLQKRQIMNTSFWESNLFQTLVLIVTIGATIGIALWQFYAHKRKELRNAVSILLLQINDIEKNIEYILSEGLINGCIQEVPIHYSTIIFEENQWNKYAHSVVGHISQEAFEKIDTFLRLPKEYVNNRFISNKKYNCQQKIKPIITIVLCITR